MHSLRKRARLILLVASTTFGLATGEFILRGFFPPDWLPHTDPPEDALMMEHPRLGYSLRPGKRVHWARADAWSVDVQVSEDGLRDEPIAMARGASLRLLAVGDSFTFGIGIDETESWPELLDRELERTTAQTVAVVNAGVPGYSIAQMRQQVLERIDRVDPAHVVLAFYARSYWRMRNPYVVFGGLLVMSSELERLAIGHSGQIVITSFRPGNTRSLDVWLKGRFHIGARALGALAPRLWPALVMAPSWTPEDAAKADVESFRPALEEIRATRDLLADRDVGFTVMVVNAQEPDGSFAPYELRYNRILAEFCAREGIAFLDPLPRLAKLADGKPILRTRGDQHWTPLAHRSAAHQLFDLLVSQGLLEARKSPDTARIEGVRASHPPP